MRVKICGMTRREDVRMASDAGADALGFISGFPKSPRNLTLERVNELVKEVPPFVDTVLVTTSENVVNEGRLLREIHPSFVQLYNEDSSKPAIREMSGAKIIKPYLVGNTSQPPDLEGFDALLSDTFVDGRFGGTGKVSDWGACRKLRDAVEPLPFILSGGLSANNVREGISIVQPYAVDVSSGVEASPGVKDSSKIRAFLRAAREGE